MKNYIEKGEFLHTVLADTVKGGDVVITEDTLGIAVSDGNGASLCAVAVEGVFELPKATGVAMGQGKKAYFISADKTVTGVASGNTLIGYVWETADAANHVVRVKIG